LIPHNKNKQTIMKMTTPLLALAGLLLFSVNAFSQDTNFWIFLCFGQSNMEGYPGVQEQDKTNVDDRFQLLASVDFPNMDRKKDDWYTAVPPLCRPGCGLCPVDYFGRTLVANLPKNIKVGVVVVAVAGCKIELFEKTNYQAYAATPINIWWTWANWPRKMESSKASCCTKESQTRVTRNGRTRSKAFMTICSKT
jgi:hypothetical protein